MERFAGLSPERIKFEQARDSHDGEVDPDYRFRGASFEPGMWVEFYSDGHDAWVPARIEKILDHDALLFTVVTDDGEYYTGVSLRVLRPPVGQNSPLKYANQREQEQFEDFVIEEPDESIDFRDVYYDNFDDRRTFTEKDIRDEHSKARERGHNFRYEVASLERILQASKLVPNPNPEGKKEMVTEEYALRWKAQHGKAFDEGSGEHPPEDLLDTTKDKAEEQEYFPGFDFPEELEHEKFSLPEKTKKVVKPKKQKVKEKSDEEIQSDIEKSRKERREVSELEEREQLDFELPKLTEKDKEQQSEFSEALKSAGSSINEALNSVVDKFIDLAKLSPSARTFLTPLEMTGSLVQTISELPVHEKLKDWAEKQIETVSKEYYESIVDKKIKHTAGARYRVLSKRQQEENHDLYFEYDKSASKLTRDLVEDFRRNIEKSDISREDFTKLIQELEKKSEGNPFDVKEIRHAMRLIDGLWRKKELDRLAGEPPDLEDLSKRLKNNPEYKPTIKDFDGSILRDLLQKRFLPE